MKASVIPDDLKSFLMAGVKRKHDLFGNFDGWDKLRLQDEKSQFFMDRPVSKFKVQAMKSVQVKLISGCRVEAKLGFLPTIVVEQIKGIKNISEWSTLIPVNGVFRAVPPFVKIKDQVKIVAFLPEIAFKKGSNDAELYLTRKPFVKGGDIFKPLLD